MRPGRRSVCQRFAPGIGRPSTYAATITTILDRGYVRSDKGRLRPEDVATAVMMVVNAPAGVCPVEIVLEPQRDPMRGVN